MDLTSANKLATKKSRVFIIILVVCLILFLTVIYFYSRYKNAATQSTSPESEAAALVKKVGQIIVLPAGEMPTIATVTDVNKVKSQPFFYNAANGDKALIYIKAKKAFLYRPSANKIIEVMSINIESSSAAKTATVTQSTPPPTSVSKIKIAIYNGTKVEGFSSLSKETIIEKIPEAEVVTVGNALGDYQGTEIVDIAGTHSDIVHKLQSIFAGEITDTLPKGEASAGADIVVLLGK